MRSPVAVCTMFYNEPEFLPIWLRYYGREIGIENCFLIDHSSEIYDSSILTAANLIRIYRSPQDEKQRVEAISAFVAYLLHYYETVIYTDIDELVVPHPVHYSGLVDFCKQSQDPIVTAIGLNVQHLVGIEPNFDPSRPVLAQRTYVRFVSPMCKPLVTREPIRWNRGFHSANRPVKLEEIYLFHLRNFDLETSLRRLTRTRAIPRRTAADELGAAHQRVADAELESQIRNVAKLERIDMSEMNIGAEPLKSLLARTFEQGEARLDVFGPHLWAIPDCFRGII